MKTTYCLVLTLALTAVAVCRSDDDLSALRRLLRERNERNLEGPGGAYAAGEPDPSADSVSSEDEGYQPPPVYQRGLEQSYQEPLEPWQPDMANRGLMNNPQEEPEPYGEQPEGYLAEEPEPGPNMEQLDEDQDEELDAVVRAADEEDAKKPDAGSASGKDKAKIKDFYNQKVTKAERYETILGKKRQVRLAGVVVTVEGGKKYFVRKTVIYYTPFTFVSEVKDKLSASWKLKETKDVTKSKLVDYVKACSKTFWSTWAAARMMKLE